MAATFSYAQAAKGQAPAPTSTPKSDPHTPPTTNGTFSELGPNANWADDAESTAEDKISHPQESHEPPPKPVQPKDVAVERTKSESGPPLASSDVSSPDMGASASTIPDDMSSNPPCTSSDSTWDAKSQGSEPAWIAERKERQGNEGTARSSKKGSKEPSPAPTPRKLQDAPPPAVNPWSKRAEDAKVKSSSVVGPQSITSAPIPTLLSDSKENTATKNVQPKRVDHSSQNVNTESKRANGINGLRANDSRSNSKQAAKPTSDDARGAENTPPARHSQRENKSAAPLPPSTDQSLWPTPDTIQEKKPKEAAATAEKADGDGPEAEASQGVKAPKKTWQPLPVTPNILWQTPEMNRPPRGLGEKGGRSGNSTRARGAFRGGANASKGGDRNGAKASPEKESSPRGRQALADREAMPPPSKPTRAPSAGLSREQNTRPAHEQKTQAAQAVAKGQNSDIASSGAPADTLPSQRLSVSDAIYSNGQNPAKVPPFVPGARSGSTHTKEVSENTGVAREAPSHRPVPGEGKKETRTYENVGKDWSGPHRGGKRGGRGRGGGREFANGHQPSAQYPGGYSDFAPSGPYGLPPSPSGFTSPRGGNPYGHPQQGRGGWSRGGGQRAQSIPLDNSGYGARYNTYPQMQPIPGFVPPPFEHYGYGVPAVPFVDTHQVVHFISVQVEYYFSTDNLIKDMFLRKHMDGKGFVFLDTIANFKRIKEMSTDKELIRTACLRSESVEIRVGDDNKERLRRREGWETFVLPVDQRDPSVQNDGPSQLHQPELPQWASGATFRVPGVSQSRRSYDSSFLPMNVAQASYGPFSPLAESPYADIPNGEEPRGRTPRSPMRDAGIAPAQAVNGAIMEERDNEADAFPDEQLPVLTVVVSPENVRIPNHAASRTFSNGSIDPDTIFGADGDKSADDRARSASKDEPSTNGDDGERNASRQRPGRSPDKHTGVPEFSVFWVKDRDMPAKSLPRNSAHEPYIQLRLKALDQRSNAATGQCPYDLDVLYQFWSHFLIRNFNSKMYDEFRFFANDDFKHRSSRTGTNNLIQFYAKALSSTNPIRDRILKDYVHLVKNEPPALEGQAFKQLRSAWRNGALNLKNRKKLTDIVDDALRVRLES